MRPPGELRLVLLSAARELATPAQAPTLQELAAHTQMGVTAARRTLSNLKRHGHLRIARPRVVAYRNRPVAEYEPVPLVHTHESADADTGYVDLGRLLSATWR